MAEVVVDAACGKVFEKTLDIIWNLTLKHVIILYNCKKNVQNLKQKVIELKEKQEEIEKGRQDAERRGEELNNELQKWLTDAGSLVSMFSDEVLEVDEEKAKKKCFFGMCLNPVSRYKLSKKAEQNSVSIVHQIGKASRYQLPISYPPAPVQVPASDVG